MDPPATIAPNRPLNQCALWHCQRNKTSNIYHYCSRGHELEAGLDESRVVAPIVADGLTNWQQHQLSRKLLSNQFVSRFTGVPRLPAEVLGELEPWLLPNFSFDPLLQGETKRSCLFFSEDVEIPLSWELVDYREWKNIIIEKRVSILDKSYELWKYSLMDLTEQPLYWLICDLDNEEESIENEAHLVVVPDKGKEKEGTEDPLGVKDPGKRKRKAAVESLVPSHSVKPRVTHCKDFVTIKEVVIAPPLPLAEDVDIYTKLSPSLASEALLLLPRALTKHSALKIEATRVPKLQEFSGKHLDADEAIVLGSALHADGSPYGLLVELEGPNVQKKLPSKMFRSFVLSKDFDAILPPGTTSPVSAQCSVSEKYSSRNLSAPIKANLHFSRGLSLDRGDAVTEITEWVQVPKKNVTIESNTTTTIGINSTGAASDENSQENKEELSNTTAEEPAVLEEKLKKRKVVEKTVGPGAALAEAKTKVQVLDKKDRERRRTAELKNNLESATKEKLETPEFEKISTETFVEKLDEVQDMDGENANATEFQTRLDSLKDIRSEELKAPPVAVEYARKYLTEVKEIIKEWETNKTWLPKDKIEEVSEEEVLFLLKGHIPSSMTVHRGGELTRKIAPPLPLAEDVDIYTKLSRSLASEVDGHEALLLSQIVNGDEHSSGTCATAIQEVMKQQTGTMVERQGAYESSC